MNWFMSETGQKLKMQYVRSCTPAPLFCMLGTQSIKYGCMSVHTQMYTCTLLNIEKL